MTYFKDRRGFLHRIEPGVYESKRLGKYEVSSIEVSIVDHKLKFCEEIGRDGETLEEFRLSGISQEVPAKTVEVYQEGSCQVVKTKKVEVRYLAMNRFARAYVNQQINSIDSLFGCPKCNSFLYESGSCKCTKVGETESWYLETVTIWV